MAIATRILAFGAALVGLLTGLALPVTALTLDWVTVGNSGNAAHPTGFGAVAYVYQISETEVTNAQYAELLNAVAATDTYELYHPDMGNVGNSGGIARSGSSGAYSYSAIEGRESMPVNFVSFYDALRFANWLHNGQPSGAQDATTTEDGAYTIDDTGITGNTITRNPAAEYALPSEDEWYKAAYHDAQGLLSTDYFEYPTSSDAEITCSAPTGSPNHANCENQVGGVTNARSYTNSGSPHGGFDLGGDVWEWNEEITGFLRGIRGGSFVNDPASLGASAQPPPSQPTVEGNIVGFRVVPEPGRTAALGVLILGLLGLVRRRRGVALGTAIGSLALLGVVPDPASAFECEADPAAAYHADGSPAPAAGAPHPCRVDTGYGSAETHIRVSPANGDVVEQPAMLPVGVPSYLTGALTLSTDDGETWEFLEADGLRSQTNDNAIHFDDNGRLFVAYISGYTGIQEVDVTPLVGSAVLFSSLRSPAGYADWSRVFMPQHSGTENPRFTSGPAPAGQPDPSPGEQVTYWCANTGILLPGTRLCYRTNDGGATWEQRSILFTRSVPQHPECGGDGEEMSPGDGNYPQVGPDGALWVTVQCGGNTYLAKSTDGAATFPILKRPDDSPLVIWNTTSSTIGFLNREELRVDSENRLYHFHRDGSAINLRTSTDGGQSWTDPLNLTAPAARDATVGQWAIAVGEPGQVAASYLVSRASGGNAGYVSITQDAADPNPTFYGAPINPPDEPMISVSAPGLDYIDVDIGPDGTPWASFYANCPANPEPGSYCAVANDPDSTVREGNGIAGPLATVVGRLMQHCPEDGPDLDGDGVPDPCDNCPLLANPGQEDDGGIDTTTPDGIGNACQCGDVTGNGIVNGQDGGPIKRHGLGDEPNPAFLEPGNCDVTGNGLCNGQDANAVRRIALDLESPLFGQNCHNALGLPVPPDL